MSQTKKAPVKANLNDALSQGGGAYKSEVATATKLIAIEFAPNSKTSDNYVMLLTLENGQRVKILLGDLLSISHPDTDMGKMMWKVTGTGKNKTVAPLAAKDLGDVLFQRTFEEGSSFGTVTLTKG
jgi:hypothetical protein